MNSRLLPALVAEIDLEPLPVEQVLAGEPSSGALPIDIPWLALDLGLWEHTEGTTTDVEADEVFVVLTGRATVVIEGGPTLELGPGAVGILEAGARTTWTVHETLRKVYLTPA